jgi:hypothetical protein
LEAIVEKSKEIISKQQTALEAAGELLKDNQKKAGSIVGSNNYFPKLQ